MKKNNVIILSIIITLLIFSPDTFANTSVLDSVLSQYKTEAAKWAEPITKAADFLFFALGTISLTWTLGLLLMRRGEIGEVFVELIKFSVFFGFMYFILKYATEIGTSIIDSFLSLGSKAGGQSSPLTASGIVDVGYQIFVDTSKQLSVWSPADSVILGITALLILVALCYVAVTFVAIQISAYILLNAGIFILGFGGSRWTSEMALNYYKTLIGIGLQLLTMVLLVSLGKTIMDDFNAKMGGNITFENLSIMLLTGMFLVISVSKIPPMVGGLVSGATGGTSFSGAGMALAGVAAAMATAATAMTSAASSIAKSLTGNVSGASQLIDALKSHGSDSPDTTPDIPDIGSSGSDNSSDINAQTQSNPGENGSQGDNGNKGERGENTSKSEDPSKDKENSSPEDNGNKGERGENTSKNEENISSTEKTDSGVSQDNDSIVKKPRSMGERLKQATAIIGNQVVSDVKSSFKESLHNLGANSTLGKLGQRISENSSKPAGTGSISGIQNSSSKTKKAIDQINKSQEW